MIRGMEQGKTEKRVYSAGKNKALGLPNCSLPIEKRTYEEDRDFAQEHGVTGQ